MFFAGACDPDCDCVCGTVFDVEGEAVAGGNVGSVFVYADLVGWAGVLEDEVVSPDWD